MCGITGWINLDKSTNHDAEAVLHSMCETIVHRGPDSEGLWIDDTVALGMRRLSIIDLKTGDQPVFSEDRSVIVMMNGELYNYREVRADLEKRGHKFATQTDTEILPHLYEEYGDAFCRSHQRHVRVLALGHAKEKADHRPRPLWRKAALLRRFRRQIDLRLRTKGACSPIRRLSPSSISNALRHYLSFDYVPAPMSIYKGIYKLPAAHMIDGREWRGQDATVLGS